jgi:hypothetical protein
VRSYDPQSRQWAIWWLDAPGSARRSIRRCKGKFANAAGTFYADDTFDGTPDPRALRLVAITPTSARWEQAYSPDGGKTWEDELGDGVPARVVSA